MDIPKALDILGIPYRYVSGGKEVLTRCPRCGKEKLYIHSQDGVWMCMVCGESGRWTLYLEWLLQNSDEDPSDLQRLSEMRGLSVDALVHYEIRLVGDRWLIPYRDRDSFLQTVRVWAGKIMGLPGVSPMRYGMQFDKGNRTLYICEGEWDTMAFYDMGVPEGVDWWGIPGAGIWRDEWSEECVGRDLVLCLDNDTAGSKGIQRIHASVRGLAGSVSYLDWEKVGEVLPIQDGHDLRDLRKIGVTWNDLQDWITEYREESRPSLVVQTPVRTRGDSPKTFEEVVECLGSRYILTKYHEYALRLALSQVVNLRSEIPLWIHYIGPPGAGKSSTLGLLRRAQCVYWVTRLSPRSLISGWNPGKKESKDPSQIAEMLGKLVIVSDFSEILSLGSEDREELYAILRSAYDGEIRREYGNGVVRIYRGTFSLACSSTPAIDGEDLSLLGERFMKFRMYPISMDIERRMVEVAISRDRSPEKDEETLDIFASYVDNFYHSLSNADSPTTIFLNDKEEELIFQLGLLGSYLRSTIPRDRWHREIVRHEYYREYATRISSQIKEVLTGLCVVRGSQAPSEEDWRIVHKLVLDSGDFLNVQILRYIARHHSVSAGDIAEEIRYPYETIKEYLENLYMMGVVEKSTTDLEATYTLADLEGVNLRGMIQDPLEDRKIF